MSVASKNLYDILGNADDSDDNSGPTREVVSSKTSTKKKDEPPVAKGGVRGGRAGYTDSSPRDRDARPDNRSRYNNEGGDGQRGGYRGRGEGRGRGRGRGGRGGGTYHDYRDDRHSKTGITDSQKQVDQGWGATGAEWTEETGGEADAKAEGGGGNWGEDNPAGQEAASTWANDENNIAISQEAKDEQAADAGPPPEPEPETKTWEQYQAELEEKRATLGSLPEARKVQESGFKNKKWAQAKELSRDEEEQEFIAAKEKKAKAAKEKKVKQTLEVDLTRYEGGDRGGRGGRGGRGRGDGERRGRGDGGRGDGERRGRGRGDGFRGRGEGRGDFRGGRGDRGPRGDRGDRGSSAAGVNITDTNAFPTLGS